MRAVQNRFSVDGDLGINVIMKCRVQYSQLVLSLFGVYSYDDLCAKVVILFVTNRNLVRIILNGLYDLFQSRGEV